MQHVRTVPVISVPEMKQGTLVQTLENLWQVGVPLFVSQGLKWSVCALQERCLLAVMAEALGPAGCRRHLEKQASA